MQRIGIVHDYSICKVMIMICLVITVAGCSLATAQRIPQPQMEIYSNAYQELHDRLNRSYTQWKDTDDQNSPGFAQDINSVWRVVEEWVISYWNSHPDSTPERVEAAVNGLDSSSKCGEYRPEHSFCPLSSKITPIGNNAYVVSFGYEEVESFCVVTRSLAGPAEYRVSWSLRDASVGDERTGCYHNLPGSYCPHEVYQLPTTHSGNPRFCTLGLEPQDMGMTMRRHMTIWEWTDAVAKPVFGGQYDIMIDSQRPEPGFALENGILSLLIKDDLKTMVSCGAREELPALWRILVGPQDITDLGKQQLLPELALADDMMYRVIHNESADDVAASSSVAQLHRIFSEQDVLSTEGHEGEASGHSLGMLMGWSLKDTESGRILCVEPEKISGALIFEVQNGRQGPYVTAVRLRQEPCKAESEVRKSGQ